MNIAKILNALLGAIEDDNMTVLTVILISVIVLFAVNIIFGTVQGTRKDGFNVGKFFFGIFKAIVICLTTLFTCYGFNLLCIGLSMADFLTFSSTFIGGAQIVAVVSVYGKDLALEVLDKFKSFRDLKYISWDDVTVQENPQQNKGIC